MNSDFWIKKWQQGETRFHQSQYHPLLVKFVNKFTKGTVLVPLCGKTLDMHFLVTQGHFVIGVELSPIACKDFFEEAGINYTTRTIEDFIVFESESIVLWCGDFFKLPEDVWTKVTGLYDRAALVALPVDVRKIYAMEISQRARGHAEMLLVTFEYDQSLAEGPPFSVKELEVKDIYKQFSITNIHSEKEEKMNDNSKFKGMDVIEAAYWLVKK